MADLKDSGTRREFGSGAVRDIAEGKGRCDLLPLQIIARFFGKEATHDYILEQLERYIREGDLDALYWVTGQFCRKYYGDFSTAFLEVAKQYEDGALKYAARNWERGIPLHCYIDSAVRHYLKYLRGDTDEPHDRAFVWNMLGAIWTHENKPEMIDLPFADGEETQR